MTIQTAAIVAELVTRARNRYASRSCQFCGTTPRSMTRHVLTRTHARTVRRRGRGTVSARLLRELGGSNG